MFYSKLLSKDDSLLKNEILHSFMILEAGHKSKRGESLQISLHCENDFDNHNPEFWNNDIELFMKVDQVTEAVKDFAEKWGLVEENNMSKELKHILGNYGSSVKCLDCFIAE